jgi:hypothetical protein
MFQCPIAVHIIGSSFYTSQQYTQLIDNLIDVYTLFTSASFELIF